MKLFKKFLIGLFLFLVSLLVISFVLPASVSVSRSIVINAGPEKVFPQINNLKNFQKWSPWDKRDPGIKLVFSGPEQGVGQKISWVSVKDDVSMGTQIITASKANSKVDTELDFGDMGKATTMFTLTSEKGGTQVTWKFYTEFGQNPLGRWAGIFFDSMLGKNFEKGLEKLKAIAEK